MLITEHLMAGLLIANANEKTKSAKYIIISIASCIIADLPVLFLGKPGEVGYLSHRIYTHSILLLPFYSLIPIVIGYLLFKKSFKNNILFLYLISVSSYLSHILFDLFTPYGVQLFYPFSKEIYSLDLFHSFDPVFITISISFLCFYLFWIVRNRNLPKIIVLIFTLIILSYTFVTFVRKIQYHNQYYSFIKSQKNEINYITTLPRTFFRWKGIAEDTGNYYSIFKEKEKLTLKKYTKNIEMPVAVLSSSDYEKFNDYARFPVLITNKKNYSFINMVYSPTTYNLTFNLDKSDSIISSQITGFDFYDRY